MKHILYLKACCLSEIQILLDTLCCFPLNLTTLHKPLLFKTKKVQMNLYTRYQNHRCRKQIYGYQKGMQEGGGEIGIDIYR